LKRKLFVIFAALLAVFFIPGSDLTSGCTGNFEACAAYSAEYSDYAPAYNEISSVTVNLSEQTKSTEKSEKKKFSPVRSLIIAFVISAIIALIVVFSIKSGLKTVRKKYEASSYVIKDSLDLRENSDTFLYKKVDKTERSHS